MKRNTNNRRSIKGIADPYAHRVIEAESDRKTLLVTFAFSSICHLVLFAVLIFYPHHAWDRKPPLAFIDVSIVTLPTSDKSAPPADKAPAVAEKQPPVTHQQTPPKPIDKAIPVAANKSPAATPVATESKKKIKRSLKKKTFKTTEVVKSAIDKIEKRVEESRPDTIAQAIDRLRDQVKSNAAGGQKKNREETTTASPAGAGRQRALELIDLYRVEIAYQIQKNWAFSEQLAGGRTDLVAELAFSVMPNGQIKNIWFDKRSGNKYFDDSAKKAIVKSNPVRPHPPGIRKPYINVGLRFTPKGIE